MTEAAREKAALRRRLRQDRRGRPAADRAAASAGVRALLARGAVPGLAQAELIGVYLPTPWEVDLRPLYARWRSHGRRLALPARAGASEPYRPARFPVQEAELEARQFGILEPRTPQWIDPVTIGFWLVPGLAFDKGGWRLGHGGGAFDRLLVTARRAVFCGVAFSWQVVERLPHEPHDVRMHFVITEEGVWGPGRFADD